MLTNRITHHLNKRFTMKSKSPKTSRPPANFALVPPTLLGSPSHGHMAWYEQLYRMAYQAAKADVSAARAAQRARWN
jgi:hypothetical protein